jgi:hypothetical protein
MRSIRSICPSDAMSCTLQSFIPLEVEVSKRIDLGTACSCASVSHVSENESTQYVVWLCHLGALDLRPITTRPMLQAVMAMSCLDGVDLLVECILRSLPIASWLNHLCPFFALSGLNCLHRRLRNIVLSPHITQLDMPEDEGHYLFAVRLVKVLHSIETAINQAVTEVIEQHVDLVLELFVAPFVAIQWSNATGPTRSQLVCAPLVAYVSFLHSTLQRCAPFPHLSTNTSSAATCLLLL